MKKMRNKLKGRLGMKTHRTKLNNPFLRIHIHIPENSSSVLWPWIIMVPSSVHKHKSRSNVITAVSAGCAGFGCWFSSQWLLWGCFGFVLGGVVIAHWCLHYFWAVFAQHQALFCLSHHPRWMRIWEGTQPGHLTSVDHRVIPYAYMFHLKLGEEVGAP